ncbi:MAG: uridine diphosphate-N-acetylglucosamine-binding protein YvcK [Actinomycetota bacterium]|nr:uridine diphosphate-N-acetylglucosamine-binding protein YvcK [Actinomycetota bacterium]
MADQHGPDPVGSQHGPDPVGSQHSPDPVGSQRPSVVAMGGGHGLAQTLAAARRYAGRITAVVSVADDGGSSGRLRAALPIPAPGDLRRCLVALSKEGSVWARAFQYRFQSGELEGHALGNLVITGLAAVSGDFLAAVGEVSALLGTEGTVLPATVEPVKLAGHGAGGPVEGQAAMTKASSIASVHLLPSAPEPPQAALEALAAADQIVLGPGSLYTSVLAVLAVPKLREAVASSKATVVYVANLRPQMPETAGYDVARHVEALQRHGVQPSVVLCDTTQIKLGSLQVRHLDTTLASSRGAVHDVAQLAEALQYLVG